MLKTKLCCHEIIQGDYELVRAFIIKYWYDIRMVIRNEIVDLSETKGLYIIQNEEIIGVLTYRVINDEAEITLLHAIIENSGIGTFLIERFLDIAKHNNIKRITVVTTNDNIRALAFYQKRGFDIISLYRNSMDYVRRIKPSVPLIGDNNIPLKHEIELELLL